ncbi:MAG: GNAT family N-acetyltransferase [Bacteroidia bacterium]|nr:GNAT family N-acetyltransferase [Bacteroidia bacterium]MBT8309217.1 GNAT family N-acetyltransferase [Bacteroidia bacterium]NND10747.1 GNAT family N-acetyltransferase [Flavobacteriaceae bacterium]NNK27740.1 GNAT family N-acetyltransferase [Flavobacteriaceae bacterium]NNL61352.1 GNAT family N-acetyltransferase [Flavobacteriaceae bacterium]
MQVIIRKATIEDAPQMLELIKELALFEEEPDEVEITAKELEADGFGTSPAFTCFVAENNNSIVGMALVYYRYSTWKGKVIHLEDLIVKQDSRGMGIGTLLLDKVIKFSSNLGVKRISWEVLDWNEPAIDFYEKKGARIMRDWDVVQLDEKGIKNYLSRIN